MGGVLGSDFIRPRTNLPGRVFYYFLTYFLRFLVPVSPA